MPFLTGKDRGTPHSALFWQMFDKDHAVVRIGDDKFIDLSKQNTTELYDLSRDKAESNDLIDAQPEKARQLQDILDAWTSELEPARFDPLGTWNPPGPANEGL